MEAVKFLANRQIDLNSLFTIDTPTDIRDDYKTILLSLGNALEKQVRTWWDVCTMEQYLKENITVRSLRWEVTPQDGLDDKESMSEWLDFFNGVSFKLQQLVLNRKRRKMCKLEKSIADLYGKLDPIKDTQQWTDFNTAINAKLDKIDKDTQKKKVKKFHRDLNDFKNESIYIWQSKMKQSGVGGITDNPPPLPTSQIKYGDIPRVIEHSTPRKPIQHRGDVLPHSKPKRGRGKEMRGRSGNATYYSHPDTQYHYPGMNNGYQGGVPVTNRFDPLCTQGDWMNAYSPRPFLGRGKRGNRGHQSNRPYGYPPPGTYYPPPTQQGWWKPPPKEKDHQLPPNSTIKEGGVVGLEGGSKKRKMDSDK